MTMDRWIRGDITCDLTQVPGIRRKEVQLLANDDVSILRVTTCFDYYYYYYY